MVSTFYFKVDELNGNSGGEGELTITLPFASSSILQLSYLLRLSWSMLVKPRGESVSCSITACGSLVSSTSFSTATADSISTATLSSSWPSPD